MTAFVLVTYTTRYGSTQEVAEAIASTLREHGLKVEVQPAPEVRTLEGYGAVVLGAALYAGQWHRDARSFLKRHRTALSERPNRDLRTRPTQFCREGAARLARATRVCTGKVSLACTGRC